MKTLLICPTSRPAIGSLTKFAPLAAIPLLGQSLLEYWLTHLAACGVREVQLLADDRPEQIATIAGNGARWGLQVEEVPQTRELTPAQAQIKYATTPEMSQQIYVLDHFPGLPQSLFTSYADLFAGLIEWLPRARTPDRVGVREIRPGVWTGWHARISDDAQLHAPCWIGQNAYVGAQAVIGPMAILEDRAFVEPEAEITGSVIGADTFVGRFAAIQNSFACGSTLIHWKSGVCTEVKESFLLASLRPSIGKPSESFFGRLTEIYSRNKDDLQMFWKHFLMNKEG